MTWREMAAPRIAAVLAQNEGADPATLKQALFDAYPWGVRRHHPYKIWLDEIARQTGRKKLQRGAAPADPRQDSLF